MDNPFYVVILITSAIAALFVLSRLLRGESSATKWIGVAAFAVGAGLFAIPLAAPILLPASVRNEANTIAIWAFGVLFCGTVCFLTWAVRRVPHVKLEGEGH
jgi:protein-S-isoprenylcysteine O-methyltransferase Ste14